MRFFYFTVLFVLLFSHCASSSKVRLVGVATNAKAGAGIMLSDEKFYYVNGLSEWDDKFLNHQVVVKGVVDSIITELDSTDIRQVVYDKYLIKNPKYRRTWSLLEIP